MIKKVVLTPTALSNYEDILEYLIENWGVTVVNDFIARLVEVRVSLSKNTEIYPFENKSKRIQRCVVTKHNVLYFRQSGFVIEILIIFDTRQDPKKLRRLLK